MGGMQAHKKVRDREDALANTRDACVTQCEMLPQSLDRSAAELVKGRRVHRCRMHENLDFDFLTSRC
jgi:hypothetical protein